MSIKNRARDLIRPNSISHLEENGSVKEFERYRIELMKELDYKIIKHKFDIAEKTTAKDLYNKAEKNIGNIVDDVSNISSDVAKHSFRSLYYTFGTIISLVTFNYFNTELFIKTLYEQPKYIADFFRSNIFLQNKGFVSQFESYISQRLKDPGKYEYEVRQVVDKLHFAHKSMMEYDNSGYLKLATISLLDVVEDISVASFSMLKSGLCMVGIPLGMVSFNLSFMLSNIYGSITNIIDSLPYMVKINLDLFEASVYLSIGAASKIMTASSYILYGAASAIYLSEYAISNIYSFLNDNIEIYNIKDTIINNQYIDQFCNYKDNITANIKYIANDVTENAKYYYNNIYDYISSIDVIGDNIEQN